MAQPVPGRDAGGGVGVTRGLSVLRSVYSLLDPGREGRKFDSRGWPKTRPVVAAAVTVPVPISYSRHRQIVSKEFLGLEEASIIEEACALQETTRIARRSSSRSQSIPPPGGRRTVHSPAKSLGASKLARQPASRNPARG